MWWLGTFINLAKWFIVRSLQARGKDSWPPLCVFQTMVYSKHGFVENSSLL